MAKIRLNIEALEAAQRDKGWNETELCKRSGLSRSQLWRIRLPEDDPRKQQPGNEAIAGLLNAFDMKFHQLFVVDTHEPHRSA